MARPLDLAADEEEEALEVVGIDVSRAADKKVGDFGLSELAELAEFVWIDGDFAPSDEGDVAASEDGFGEGFHVGGNAFGKEKDADAEVGGFA